MEDHGETGPEVFESSDVESIEPISAPEDAHSDVDRAVLDPKLAKSKFENSAISDTLEPADFLGNVTHHGLYQSGYTFRRVHETTAQKLARIHAELAELETEKETEDEVARLSELLDKLVEKADGTRGSHDQRLRAIFQRLDESISGDSRVTSASSASKAKTSSRSSTTDIVELEKRLHDLESIVGVSELQSAKNVRSHIDDLGRKVEVLYDTEFDLAPIKNEIKRLAKEMDDFNTKRRVAKLANGDVPYTPTTPFDAKVDAVYEVIPDIEKSIEIVPQLVSRLRTLHQVHADLAHSVTVVSEVDKTIKSLELDMKSWSENLDLVNSAIDAHAKTFEDTKAAVETKVLELEKRLSGVS